MNAKYVIRLLTRLPVGWDRVSRSLLRSGSGSSKEASHEEASARRRTLDSLPRERMKHHLVQLALVTTSLLAIGGSGLEAQADTVGQNDKSADIAPPGKRLKKAKSPQAAFEAGEYDRAAQGFAERTERRPGDTAAQLNLGSALHQLEDYDAARSAFERAAAASDRRLRAKATYDLGNTAYRQGRLEEAIERYREALDLDSDDEDAKHNLEFVQLELERRKKQAEQRRDKQEEQDKQPDSEKQEQSSEQGEGDEQGDQQPTDEKQPPDAQDGNEKPQDSDGDGLTDQQERSAENPTDPQKKDTDGDGRSDGEEDANRNGKVDPGESDPNRADQSPEQQEENQEPSEGDQSAQEQTSNPDQELTLDPEQVKRLLAALEDHRPPASRGKQRAGKQAKRAKDW